MAEDFNKISQTSDVVEQEESKYFPFVWAFVEFGSYRIENICPDRIEEAIKLILNGFVKEEQVCLYFELDQDVKGLELFGQICRNWMKSGTSLCAIQDVTGKMVGVVVARDVDPIEPSRSFLEIRPDLLPKNIPFENVLEWRQYVHNNIQQYYLDMGLEKYFEIYGCYVLREHRNKGVGRKLIKAVQRMADLNGCNELVGTFTNARGISFAMNLFPIKILSIPINYKLDEKPDKGYAVIKACVIVQKDL